VLVDLRPTSEGTAPARVARARGSRAAPNLSFSRLLYGHHRCGAHFHAAWVERRAHLLLDNLIRPQQQRRRDRQRGLGGAGRGGRGRRGGRVGFGVGGAGPSCEVADVRSRRVRGGRRSRLLPLEHFALASLDETFPTRRVVFLGVAACAHPEPPQSDALAQHLITALGALGNPERRMFF